ncbi:MAG TPA: efflux RND transporter periplasmic adaptor subunit [Patescibacteria group bacterium]|jgi:HlyD family secretion protein|nr:efflux RND transporter periplasmic adaptor subunit [Patescibacteria group bacterium]
MSSSSQTPKPAAAAQPARHTVRRWVPYIGGGLLLALIVAGLWPKPIQVETAVAARGPLQVTINEEGKTRIKQRYVVAAPVSGQLRRIAFKAGAEVIAGRTVVAVIDPVAPTLLDERTRTMAETKRESAAANLDKARDAHDFAARELGRFQKLFADKTISVQELEQAQLRETSTEKELAAAQSALHQAEAELDQFLAPAASGTNGLCAALEIRAPASGRVLKVLEENSRVVAAGTPLMELGDPADLEVVIDVLSRDGARIPPGAKVEFDQWGGPQPLLGRVRLVEPAAFTKVSALGVEEQRVNVVADLTTPADQRIGVGDNFRVEARIIVWESADALKLPAGALFRQGERWATFALAEDRARLKLVDVGPSSGTETQILNGIDPGTLVILYPSSRVHDSQRVTPVHISPR